MDLIPKPDAVEAVRSIEPVEQDRVSESRSPTTTVEQDKLSLARREINRTWENTQARIALSVVLTTCLMVLTKVTIEALLATVSISIPPEWWTILGLVIGFYFGRTNHARQGDATIT